VPLAAVFNNLSRMKHYVAIKSAVNSTLFTIKHRKSQNFTNYHFRYHGI